ncbi:MAG: endopeptidase La [Clostridia bacterium]|nr:endopeptidase La [Clostridia bacterium]
MSDYNNYIEKAENLSLPVIVLNGTVAFPSVNLSFEISEKASIAAAKAALETNSFVLLVTNKNSPLPHEKFDDLYSTGCVAKIKQSLKTPDKHMRLIVEGYSRANITKYSDFADYIMADAICKTIHLKDDGGFKSEALIREGLNLVEKIIKFLPSSSSDLLMTAKTIKNPGLFADFVASNFLVKFEDKQTVLECFEPIERIECLIFLLNNESDLLNCEFDIHRQVREALNKHQQEYYLREQIKVIREKLGDDSESECDEYDLKIEESALPEELKEKLLKENARIAKMPFGTAEASILRNYIDVCLDLPWGKRTKDSVNIAKAKKILDADHDGLEKVKERILEYLAVKQLSPELKNQIICLVGPPGVGKTSIASSIARAMNRKYVRVSLGGVRDEADIRGHRKTYIGAMPGRIINALTEIKVSNPLILLDEIDKLTRDSHGDPASALLEVLDAEQNKNFRDHFVEYPFDLSDCLFIATANSYEGIPRPLLDRMEVIELKIYTKREKLEIAKNHLIPKQLKRHGLTKRSLKISDDALCEIIDFYTREAGVRNLERTVAELCRKAAKKIIENNVKCVNISTANLEDFLGARKLLPESISAEDEIGVVNGLAYTELGGSMLKIEVAVLDGTGKIEITGSLGEVMQESAKIAVSYVRSVAKEYGIDSDFYKTKDIHIHAPEGAVPKDGPSAGVTITTALISALTGRPVRRDVAMTGEITLRGNVLAIGGLKEKTMAAYNAGVKRVLIPADNEKDLNDIDPLAKENLEFIPCRKIADVLSQALCTTTADESAALMSEKLPELSQKVGVGVSASSK